MAGTNHSINYYNALGQLVGARYIKGYKAAIPFSESAPVLPDPPVDFADNAENYKWFRWWTKHVSRWDKLPELADSEYKAMRKYA